MSVGSIGQQGLADDQDVSSWDPGMETYSLVGAQSGTILSGAISTSSFGGIAVGSLLPAGQLKFSLFWYDDQALTKWVGQVSVFMDSNVIQPMQLLVPSLGSWVDVQHQPSVGSPNFTSATYVMLTNRHAPAFMVPANVPVISTTPNIPAGGTVNVYTRAYVSGRVSIYTTGGSQGVSLQLQVLDVGLVYAVRDTWTVAAGAQDYRERIVPGGAFRIVTTNTSGAVANNTSVIGVTASMAGAA